MKIPFNEQFKRNKCPNCSGEYTFEQGSSWDSDKGRETEYYCYVCGYSYCEVWVFGHNIENFEGRDNWFEDEEDEE